MQFLIDIGLSILYFCIFILLCAWAWRFWIMYINQKFLNSLDWVMLEIKLPREIAKSPFATEVALASLLQGGGVGTKFQRLFRGNLPAFSSLEIASLEGVIHFYVRIQKKFRPLVEANFYAQYPDIEIVEAEDYTKLIHYQHLTKEVSLWGANYKTTKTWNPDPSNKDLKMAGDFYPIKTYTDYGLDQNPKEEYKIDPIVPILEIMGGIGKGEYFWYQILIQDEGVYNGKKMPKFYVNEATHEHKSLMEIAEERKKQLRGVRTIKVGDVAKDDFGEVRTKTIVVGKDADGKPINETVDVTYKEEKTVGKKDMDLTMEEKSEIEAINNKFAKPLALVVMRALYITKKENFNPAHINDILSLPKPFGGWNTLAPAGVTEPYEFPWQNYKNRRVPWRAEEKFEAYVEREGFFPHIPPRESLDKWEDMFFWTSTMKSRKIFRMIYEAILHPFDHPHAEEAFTLNLEEVATLWHLPGSVAATPTLPRIDSAKGQAPVNLPL